MGTGGRRTKDILGGPKGWGPKKKVANIEIYVIFEVFAFCGRRTKTDFKDRGLPHLPGLENGPGFDSQGSVNFFTKYCFSNLHRIHVKAFEVEDCEFVPVHHQQK